MKKTLFILTFILTGCCIKNESTLVTEYVNDSSAISYVYEDFAERLIIFDTIFDFDEDHYVYIFSKSCQHCENIKNAILDFAFHHENFYMVEFDKNIKLSCEVESTIGATSIDDVYILGTPTLLYIQDGVLCLNIAGEKNIIQHIVK